MYELYAVTYVCTYVEPYAQKRVYSTYVHPVCAQAEHACYLQSSASDELVAGSTSDSKRPAVAGFTVRVVFPVRESDGQE